MACTKNPIIEYINSIINQHAVDPTKSFNTLMANNFSIIGQNTEYCCSDCGYISFLGPVTNSESISMLDAVYSIMGDGTFPKSCCENYDISDIHLIGSLNIISNSIKYQSKICCNDFNKCSTTFTDLMQKYLFAGSLGAIDTYDTYRKGIHEYGTINGNSSLCLLVDKIQHLSDIDKKDFLDAFFTQGGFIVFCEGSNVWVGSTKSFLNWW